MQKIVKDNGPEYDDLLLYVTNEVNTLSWNILAWKKAPISAADCDSSVAKWHVVFMRPNDHYIDRHVLLVWSPLLIQYLTSLTINAIVNCVLSSWEQLT